MDMNYKLLQAQNDKIYSYFKTTTESFDSLEWDGHTLNIVENYKTIEVYKYGDLKSLITNL